MTMDFFEDMTMAGTKRYGTVIGIDPDVDRSGVAALDAENMSLTVAALRFPELVDYLSWRSGVTDEYGNPPLVVVEASWKTAANWHLNPRDGRRAAAKKGYGVGRNHETGRKIVEMAESFGLPVIERQPLLKCWKGPDGKITHVELESLLTGSGVSFGFRRTNQEERDAALLALDASGIPMRMRGGAR